MIFQRIQFCKPSSISPSYFIQLKKESFKLRPCSTETQKSGACFAADALLAYRLGCIELNNEIWGLTRWVEIILSSTSWPDDSGNQTVAIRLIILRNNVLSTAAQSQRRLGVSSGTRCGITDDELGTDGEKLSSALFSSSRITKRRTSAWFLRLGAGSPERAVYTQK